jgi:hypothetical protein
MRCPNCGYPYPSAGICSFCRAKNDYLYSKTGTFVNEYGCSSNQIERALAKAEEREFIIFDSKKKKEPWETY